MKPHTKHRSDAVARLSFVVVTVSTSRFRAGANERETDVAGDVACEEVARGGHFLAGRTLVSDDLKMIQREVRRFLSGKSDVLILTGGTGLSKSDVTVESVRPFFEKEMEGFGELVRRLSYNEIGSAAILSRMTAGVAGGKLILCLPGSPDAVRVSLQGTMDEFAHAVYIARH